MGDVFVLKMKISNFVKIDTITPNPANESDRVFFYGNATGNLTIEGIYWYSSRDGVLSTKKSFNITTLSNGTHIIELVMRHKEMGKEKKSTTLIINGKPRAIINEIKPSLVNNSENVWFYGNGTDDGKIVAYKWNSNIDGFLSNEKFFQLSNLSKGNHTIYLKVKDNKNVWSKKISLNLSINNRPTVNYITPVNGEIINKNNKIYVLKGIASDDIIVKKVKIKIDDQEWHDAEGTIKWTFEWDLTDVNNGKHTLKVRAFDGSIYSETETIEVEILEGNININIKDEDAEKYFKIIYILPIFIIITIIGVIGIKIHRTKSLITKSSKVVQKSKEDKIINHNQKKMDDDELIPLENHIKQIIDDDVLVPFEEEKKINTRKCPRCGGVIEITIKNRPIIVKCLDCKKKYKLKNKI